MVPARLSLVTLGTRDLPALAAFYRGLGWQVAVEEDDFASFLLGGVVLALYPLALLGKEAAPGERVPARDEWSGVTLALTVDEREQVDDVFAEMVGAGARPVQTPQDRPWGGRSAYVADPENNRWEIAWAPGAVFDERGAVVAFGPN